MMPKVVTTQPGLDRRQFIRVLGAAASSTLIRSSIGGAGSDIWRDELARFPQKTDLILRTDRPPQLETPLHHFREDLTPNEAFYVRWHLEGIPTSVDLRSFRLQIGGEVRTPLSLSVSDLRNQFEPVSLIAVNQCSGNSRSFFEPRVPGGQWKNGAMGNARWTGVRLRELLDHAGVKNSGVEVSFNGLDQPSRSSTPDFVKALSIDHALDGEVMVAYEMNGAELPMLNGFPLRLVVPGWYATYWVKALNDIQVLSEKFRGFWMDKAYRIPTSPGGKELPDNLAAETVPISRMTLRSLFVRPEPGEQLHAKVPFEIQGIAFDGGSGIERVEVSTNAGRSWEPVQLDPELGRYSWRRWRLKWTPPEAGKYPLQVRAFSRTGEQQTTSLWNRSGYMRNVIEHAEVEVL
jgi:DMSO/TMAO reductase YedYZ molybdopterin-dependent catalytic subunit